MYISEIVKNNLCTGCGVCTSENSKKEKRYKMALDKDGFLVPTLISGKFEDEESAEVCPFADTKNNDEDEIAKNLFVNADYNSRIGRFLKTYIGYANDFRDSSSSGGLATFVFEELLKKRIVDHLFIVKELEGKYSYQLFSNVAQIKKTSKTRYFPVTLEDLFDNIDKIEGTVAVSGVACFIKAIRLKQLRNPELKEKIPFLVGIICGGLKSKHYTDFLAYNVGIKGNYHDQEYRIKDEEDVASAYSFGAFDNSDATFKTMKMRKVGDMWGSGLFKSFACDFCNDVTTELADISLGDAWIQPYIKEGKGTSIVITRSSLADEIVREGLAEKTLTLMEIDKNKIIESQRGSFFHRQLALKYRLKENRKKLTIQPAVRKRLLTDIPFEFRKVQKYRSFLRAYSLEEWNNQHDKDVYNASIKTKQLELRKLTQNYHKIQKIRRILKLKNLNEQL